jgi:hypothetical protein
MTSHPSISKYILPCTRSSSSSDGVRYRRNRYHIRVTHFCVRPSSSVSGMDERQVEHNSYTTRSGRISRPPQRLGYPLEKGDVRWLLQCVILMLLCCNKRVSLVLSLNLSAVFYFILIPNYSLSSLVFITRRNALRYINY